MEKMKIKKETWRKAGMIAGSTVAAALVVLGIVFGAKQCARTANADPLGEEETTDRNLLYGIEYENYDVVTEQVGNGQTLSHILGSLGVGPATVDRIDTPTPLSWNRIRWDAGSATSSTKRTPWTTSWYRSRATR